MSAGPHRRRIPFNPATGLRPALAVAAGLSLGACALGPEYRGSPPTPAVAGVDRFPAARSAVGDPALVNNLPGGPVAAVEPPADWWAQFDDPTLDGLIAQAFAANHDLRVASANLAAARAVIDVSTFDLLPDLTASADVARARPNNAAGGLPEIEAETVDPTNVQLGFAWEIDLFGRVRRSIEAAVAEAGGALALQRDAQVAIASEVARAYTELRGAQARRAVTRRNIRNLTNTLALTEVLVEAGRSTQLDIARAAAQVQQARAVLPALEAAETAARNRLTVLTGLSLGSLDERLARPELDSPIGPPVGLEDLDPGAPARRFDASLLAAGAEPATAPLDDPNAGAGVPRRRPEGRLLPDLPAFVAVGDPATLIRRRPDIRAAERALAAASARIGATTADLFPRVSLSGALTFSALSPQLLGAPGADGFSIGPAVSWSIVDIGQTLARIRQAEAVADGELARYEQTVVTALAEVDTAISTYLRERQRNLELSQAVAAAREAARLARIRYEAGVEAFDAVLDSERELLLIEDLLVQSDIDLTRSVIDVYGALGGGWQVAPDPQLRSFITANETALTLIDQAEDDAATE